MTVLRVQLIFVRFEPTHCEPPFADRRGAQRARFGVRRTGAQNECFPLQCDGRSGQRRARIRITHVADEQPEAVPAPARSDLPPA